MTTYMSLSAFKAEAEFLPVGRIVPRRIFKGPRKATRHTKLLAGVWAVRTEHGYVCAVDQRDKAYFMSLSHVRKNTNFQGSPYTHKGVTQWISNAGITDGDWLRSLNQAINNRPTL